MSCIGDRDWCAECERSIAREERDRIVAWLLARPVPSMHMLAERIERGEHLATESGQNLAKPMPSAGRADSQLACALKELSALRERFEAVKDLYTQAGARAEWLEAALRDAIEWIKAERRDCGCTDRILANIELKPFSAIESTPPPPNMSCKHTRIRWGDTGLAESVCLDCGRLNPSFSAAKSFVLLSSDEENPLGDAAAPESGCSHLWNKKDSTAGTSFFLCEHCGAFASGLTTETTVEK